MNVKTYLAVPGSRLSDRAAERVGTFLDERFGDAPRTPADVVAAARPKRSPLHGDFEWDDTVAAENYRLEQATHLLRSVQVVFVNGTESTPTRAYHRVTLMSEGDPGGVRSAYVPATVVWTNPDLAAQVKAAAKRDVMSAAKRLREYEAFADVASRLVAIADELEGIAA